MELGSIKVRGSSRLDGAVLSAPEDPVALNANGATFESGLFLCSGLVAAGEIQLMGSSISGQLDFSGASVSASNEDKAGRAVSLDRGTVDGNIYFVDRFSSTGEVSLAGSKVSGQVVFKDSTIQAGTGTALNLVFCKVSGDVLLHEESRIEGQVDARSAYLGSLELSNASLCFSNDVAVRLEGATLPGGIACVGDVRVKGEFRLVQCELGGQLQMDCIRIEDAVENGLSLDGLTLRGSLKVRHAHVAGRIHAVGIDVSGQVDFSQTTVRGSNGIAAYFDASTITGDFKLDRLTSIGLFSVSGSEIGGNLEARGARVFNETDPSIVLDGTSVGDCHLEMLESRGTARLVRMKVRGQIVATDVRLRQLNGIAIVFQWTSVAADLIFTPQSCGGVVDLSHLTVNTWRDSRLSWPSRLLLRGFTYDSLESTPKITTRERINWLDSDQHGFTPGPFQQLAASLNAVGETRDSNYVLIALQKRYRRRQGLLRPVSAIASWLNRLLFGYGYAPLRLLLPAVVLYLSCVLIFSLPAVHIDMVPVNTLDKRYEFCSFRYALDLMVPGASIGDRARFTPLGIASSISALYTMLGWLFAAYVVAGLAGLYKKK